MVADSAGRGLASRRGREVEMIDGEWHYTGTGIRVWDGPCKPTIELPCPNCNLTADTPYGPDPCIGYIDGLLSACCGHGLLSKTYIVFDDDDHTGLTGIDAHKFLLERVGDGLLYGDRQNQAS